MADREERKKVTANRVAAVIALLGAAAAFITTLLTDIAPGTPWAEALGKAGVMVGALLVAMRVIEKFLDGSQNWDSLTEAGVPKADGVTVVHQVSTSMLPPPPLQGDAPVMAPPPPPPPPSEVELQRASGFGGTDPKPPPAG
jgi:cytochrome c oxidase assembly factor CtaG